MASHWYKGVLVAIAAMAIAGAPAAAQQPLSLKSGKAWKHEHSGITVPATLGGLQRDKGMAYAQDDLDVGLSYTVRNAAESLTFYVFRNTNGAVPVWFAQAQWGIEQRDTFGHPPLAIAPEAFAPPGQTVASGLRAFYAPKSGSYRSTGVAMLPVGGWYVKVRASSQSRSPEALANWVESVLAEIGWPRDIAAAAAAQPITPCTEPLRFEAIAADANGGDLTAEALGVALMSAAAGDETIKKKPESAVRWCRDRQLEGNIATYRPGGSTTEYLLAYGDNGNGIWTGPSPMKIAMDEIAAKKGGTASPRYAVTLHTAMEDVNFVLQDRLPSPERVADILNANRRSSTVVTWGKNRKIQINSAAK